MSKSMRLFIIVLFLGLSLWALWPSYQFYYLLDSETRDLINSGKTDDRLVEEGATEEMMEGVAAGREIREGAVNLGLDIRGGIHVVIEADFEAMASNMQKEPDEITDIQKEEAIDRVMLKIERRINGTGLSETTIRKHGEKRVVVQIPGVTSFDGIQEIIRRQGLLEFKLVDEETDAELIRDPQTGEVENPEILPEGTELVPQEIKDPLTGDIKVHKPLALFKTVEVSGDRISHANVQFDDFGAPAVGFQLDNKGAQQFGKVTGENRGVRLAIVLDGKVMSAPTIQSAIFGNGQITGNYTHDEAKSLSLILRSGSLPVKVNIISKDIVGPSMGQELLNKSKNALIVGLLLVMAFMVLRYRLAGVIASFALSVNAVMIFAILAQLNFTVTLPGIAGLILTIGMAIDANVIIFERIREELLIEKRDLIDGVNVGYSKAFWSIFDANFTTMIAAFILSYYGSGVLEGFAFTLFVGIIVSMFTALFMVKFIFDALFHMGWLKKYSMAVI